MLENGDRRWKGIEFALLAALLLSLGYLVYKSFDDHTLARAVDTGVYYIAGYALGHGQSPYDTSLLPQLWKQVLNRDFLPWLVFPYPPTALPLVQVVGWLPSTIAYIAIDALNIATLLLSFFALYKILGHLCPTLPRRHVLVALLIATLPTGLIEAIDFGQIPLVVIASLLWALYWLLTKKPWRAVAVLVLVASLKPQMTLVPAVAMLVLWGHPRHWMGAIGAMVLWLGAVLLVYGPGLVPQFLSVVSGYESLNFNHPDQMTGARNLLAMAGFTFSSFAALGVTVLITGAALAIHSWKARQSNSRDENNNLLVFLLVWMISEAVVSFHHYDHSLLIVPLALSFALRPLQTFLLLPALLVATRPLWVFRVIGEVTTLEVVLSITLLVAVADLLVIMGLKFPGTLTWERLWIRPRRG